MRDLYRIIRFCLICGLIVAPGFSSAEEVKNEIGLYTDLTAVHASTSIDVEPNVPFEVYMIVTNPFNEEFTPDDCSDPIGRPINFINAFQYRLLLPEAGLFMLSAVASGVLDGRAVDPPDYGVLLEDGIPVPESRTILLMTFTFMVSDSDPKFLHLVQADDTSFSTLAVYDFEEMDYVPGCPRTATQKVYPVSGDSSQPVFGINARVVAVESESWGNVKALYR